MNKTYCSPFVQSNRHGHSCPFDNDEAVYTFVPIANISPVQELESLNEVVHDNMGGSMMTEEGMDCWNQGKEDLHADHELEHSQGDSTVVDMLCHDDEESGPQVPKAVLEQTPKLLPSDLARRAMSMKNPILKSPVLRSPVPVTHSPCLSSYRKSSPMHFEPALIRNPPSYFHVEESFSIEDQLSAEHTPSRKRKRSFSGTQDSVELDRQYTVVQKNENYICGDMKDLKIQVKTRADPTNITIPPKLYSSLKYEVSAKIHRNALKQDPAGVYMCSIDVVDPDDHDVTIMKNKTQSMIAGISQHTAMTLQDDYITLAVRLRFTDVSAHHSKRDFRLKLQFFDSGVGVDIPMISVVSGTFQIFARRPKQCNRPLKRRKVKLGSLEELKEETSLSYYNDLLEQLFNMQRALRPEDQEKALELTQRKLLSH